MKKMTKALIAIGAGAACVVTGGLAAPAIGAAVGLTGTMDKTKIIVVEDNIVYCEPHMWRAR